jgi:tetratricopeptide (TPR) repeat protein
MPDDEKTVFISYRRSVSSFIARAIFLDLRAHGYDVFMDVESIDSGQFDTIILNQIAARAHFLVILTPGTVERCGEPGDWLRREIEHAIDLQRNIVPVLVNNFDFSDTESCLTGKLSELNRYNGLNLPHDYFDAGMDRLRNRFLKQRTSGMIQPTPPSERSEVERKIEEIVSQPVPTQQDLTAEQYFNSGLAYRRKGDLVRAIQSYTKAIENKPSYVHAYNNRAVARRRQGDFRGAIADYNKAIQMDPEYARAYSNRGESLFALGLYDQALSDFLTSERLRPSYHYSTAGLAISYHALENYTEAKKLWKALVDSDTHYRDANWVGEKLGWADPLIEEARKLIAKL